MSLVIKIIAYPDNVTVSESSKTFAGHGGSIGRGADNAWVLADPERFLSSCHCQISYENGVYSLTDTSTNGTFLNGSMEPMGHGSSAALKAGDQFSLGDYEFSVAAHDVDMMAGSGQAMPAASDPFASDAGGIYDSGFPASSDSAFDDPFSGGHVPASEPLFSTSAEETDPLAALDRARQGDEPDPFTSQFPGSSQSDQADVMNQAVDWPNSVPETGAIPENWDKTDLSYRQQRAAPAAAPAEPAAVIPPPPPQMQEPVAEPAPVRPRAPAATPAPKPASNRTLSAADSALVEVLGLSKYELGPKEIAEINCMVGELMRETIAGLMQVLSSRNSIKNEFRMSVTTIQPVENNPLKFSANVDDALENMFIKKGNSYKDPVEAVREGFQGIAEHQIAILAGMRLAFKGVIERFDPVILEKRFAKRNKAGLLPGSQKAKNWDSYTDYYNDLVGDLGGSFQYLFGDDFVKAYEDQLQKLAIARRENKQ